MKYLLGIFLFCLTVHAQAQFALNSGPAIKGKFYVSVDDEAQILLNGAEFHRAPLNESESADTELKPGDRIVVKLKNTLGRGRFMLLFMSSDRRQMIAFTSHSFKVLPDPGIKDFTAADFAGYHKPTKEVTGEFGKTYQLPFKSSAKYMWGDVNVCSIGCLVTADMFKANSHQ